MTYVDGHDRSVGVGSAQRLEVFSVGRAVQRRKVPLERLEETEVPLRLRAVLPGRERPVFLSEEVERRPVLVLAGEQHRALELVVAGLEGKIRRPHTVDHAGVWRSRSGEAAMMGGNRRKQVLDGFGVHKGGKPRLNGLHKLAQRIDARVRRLSFSFLLLAARRRRGARAMRSHPRRWR